MLAMVTGRGALPATIAAAQIARPLICELAGHHSDGLSADITFQIEHLGTLLDNLKERGVTEVCFCGSIDRPQFDPDELDAATMPLMPVLAAAVASGEDSALRAVAGLFEKAGFSVRAAHHLAPEIIPPEGVLSATPVPISAEADVAVALQVLEAYGAADLGQACIIHNGRVLAHEDAGGTDVMLEGFGAASAQPHMGAADRPSDKVDMAGDPIARPVHWPSGDASPGSGRAGMLFKAPKPGQDIRLDLPTIGPVTAERAAAAGLAGIVIAQGSVIVLDRPRVLDILNAAGMYLWVR